MTRRFRCVVQYVGTEFSGFQRQNGRATVQQTLEDAVYRVTQQHSVITGAGRTDAGVHALGQVVHFDSTSTLDCAALQRAINACLPESVALMSVEEAAGDFHSRFDAVSREYRYVVQHGGLRTPLLARRVLHVPGPLDVQSMQEAAEHLQGRHDFSAFGSPMSYTRADADGEEREHRGGTVRTLTVARCRGYRKFLFFCFVADAFLRHMVRMLVGTLLRVGAGRLPARAIADLLRGDRSVPAGPAAPAYGLYLVRVRYE